MISVLCDLCDEPSQGRMHDGAEFSLEGRICGECRDELRDEQRLARHRQLSMVKTPHAGRGDSRKSGRANGWLAILTPGFTAKDLTPRAVCRLMIRDEKRRSA